MGDLAVDCLAVARLTRLLHTDKIAAPVRRGLISWSYGYRAPAPLRRTPAEANVEGWPVMDHDPPFVADLLQCRWCLSVWIAAGVVAARRLAPRAWDPMARLLAASQIAGLAGMVEARLEP